MGLFETIKRFGSGDFKADKHRVVSRQTPEQKAKQVLETKMLSNEKTIEKLINASGKILVDGWGKSQEDNESKIEKAIDLLSAAIDFANKEHTSLEGEDKNKKLKLVSDAAECYKLFIDQGRKMLLTLNGLDNSVGVLEVAKIADDIDLLWTQVKKEQRINSVSKSSSGTLTIQ